MYPMRGSKVLLRLGVSLVLGAGSITTGMVGTSSSASPPLLASHPKDKDTVHFLQQSTWGPNSQLISEVERHYEDFLENQFDAPLTSYPTLPLVPSTPPADCPSNSVCRRDNYTLYPVQTHF